MPTYLQYIEARSELYLGYSILDFWSKIWNFTIKDIFRLWRNENNFFKICNTDENIVASGQTYLQKAIVGV